MPAHPDNEVTCVNPSEDYVQQYAWREAGQITSAQAALAVDARDHASVEALAAAKKVLFKPEHGSVALEFRFRSDGSENDANTIQVYAAAGDDHYTRIAQLVATQGQQDASEGHFADSIVETLDNWLTDTKVVQPSSVDNHIARYILNTHGYDRFLFIVSTLATTTVYVDVRRF